MTLGEDKRRRGPKVGRKCWGWGISWTFLLCGCFLKVLNEAVCFNFCVSAWL